MSTVDGAEMLHWGEQTIRDYRHPCLVQQMARCTYKQPPGRPSQVTNPQRRALAALSKAGPQAADDTAGGGHPPMLQALLPSRGGVAYPPPALATVLHNLGVASPQARVGSDHLQAAPGLEWRRTTWPKLVPHARQRTALRLLGDEARGAPRGSLRAPWAPTGEQPAVPPRGQRTGSQVFGRIASCSGRLVSTGHAGRLHSESDAAWLRDVLAQTRRHVVGSQDGARSHPSQAMQAFCKTPAARLTLEPWPSDSPACHPLEHLWKQVKKEATQVKYVPAFAP